MLKETAIILLISVILFFILRFLRRKNAKGYLSLIAICFGICVLLNIVFLFRSYFPTFVLDDEIPLGDCGDNLLLYKQDSEYNCEILFDLLPSREVCLDDSSESLFFEKFFNTYASGCSTEAISYDIKEAIKSDYPFDYISDLHLVYMLDYIFEDNYNLDGENTPHLYMNLNKMMGQNRLVAFSDDSKNLYLLTEDEYEAFRQGDMQ